MSDTNGLTRRGIDANELKQQAAGRWLEIVTTVAGIPADHLDGKGHPCPTCGGTDRFSAFRDFAETGGVICRHCFPKGADGLATVQHFAGVDFPTACRLVGDYVGGTWSSSTARSAITTPKGGRPTKTGSTVEPVSLSDPEEQFDTCAELVRKCHPDAVKVYRYQHANGADAGAQIRRPPSAEDRRKGKTKTFRSVSKAGNGKWVNKAMPKPRPPFRAPEVVASDGLVLIVEGEKDVETLESIGMVATTWPGGALAVKLANWEIVAGRDLVLLGDHDDAGRDAVDAVVAELGNLTPQPRVRRLTLDTLPDGSPMPVGGDVSDWIEAHGESAEPEVIRENLEALIATAEVVGLPTPEAPLPEWRPFPTHLLPDPLRSLVQEAAAAIGCDESMVALPGLAICAAAIGATRVARIKRGWKEPSILWAALIHPSGGTKSQGRKVVLEPLLAHQRRARREYEEQALAYEAQQAEYKKALKAWEKSKDNGPPPEAPVLPVEVEFITSDANVEGVIRVLNRNPRGVLLERDELAAWVKSFNQYHNGGADAQNWIGAHGGDYMKVNRAGFSKSLYVANAAVSVSGTVQPEVLSEVLKGEHTHSGFAARLLMAWPPLKVKRWSEREVSDATQRRYAERLAALLSLDFSVDEEGESYPYPVRLSAGALERFRRFVDEHGLEALDLGNAERAAHAKLEGYAARLALVMQLIDDPDAEEITEDMISRGIELTRWFGNEAARFYRRRGPDARGGVDEKLVAWIEAKGGVVTARDVQRGRRNLKTIEDVEKALDKLVAAERGEWLPFEIGEKGGQPSRKFKLTGASTPTQPAEHRGLGGSVDVDTLAKRETAFDAYSDGTDGYVPAGAGVNGADPADDWGVEP
ncbi:DUF3987 domain-containing protein [Botrimarina sp.]|uniref:DUF3987 domain-containing protein n=1 Tax=Botrimarina sp. TaxID=2795802 RepID=UPI0032EB0A44